MKKPVNRRRLLIRLVLAVIWIGLGALLFVKNRGHTVLIDNKNVEVSSVVKTFQCRLIPDESGRAVLPDYNNDQTLQLTAPDMIRVKVDKKNEMEFFKGDRDLVKVAGSRHKIRVEFNDGSAPFNSQFSLPLGPDMFLLSIPKMLNGIEPYIEVFYTQPESRNVEEEAEE